MFGCKKPEKGTLTLGATVLIAIILIIATAIVYFAFYKNVGEGGMSITNKITKQLTGLLAG